MFKKMASLVLAATMMVSAAAITASAAETDQDAAAANDQSSAVAADQSSAVGADALSSVSAGDSFKFDVNSAGWSTAKIIYCHIYRVDGTGTWPAWQAKAEKCTFDTSTKIATYNIETGKKKGFDMSIPATNSCAIIFSSDTGMETYPIIVNSSCFGDTVYAPDKTRMYENNLDSEKKSVAVQWKNHNLSAAKTITSTGKIQGDSFAEGTNDVTIMADFMITYYAQPKQLAMVQGLINKLNVSPAKVMEAVAVKETAGVKAGSKKQADADKEMAAITKKLGSCTDPTTGKKVDKKDLNNAKNKGTSEAKAGKSAADVSSSTSTGSSPTSSGSSSGSSSVKSGQETTIFFVFGGLMLAAAGVMFIARKKREE